MAKCLLKALILSSTVYFSNVVALSAGELSAKETRHAFVRVLSQTRSEPYINASVSFTQSLQTSRYIDAWRTTYRDEFVTHTLAMFFASQSVIKNEEDLSNFIVKLESRIPEFASSREHVNNPAQFSDIFSVYLIDELDQLTKPSQVRILSESEAAVHYQLKQILDKTKVEHDNLARALVLRSNRVIVYPGYSAITDAVADHLQAFSINLIYKKDIGTWVTALPETAILKPATELVSKLLTRKALKKADMKTTSFFRRCFAIWERKPKK